MSATTRQLSEPEAALVAAGQSTLAALIGCPTEHWAGSCHSVSLALLRTGEFGPGRIARGTAPGVGSQHSWIVLGPDVYSPDALIVDPTIEYWTGQENPQIVVARAHQLAHVPHGKGSIWHWGRPSPASGPAVKLTPAQPLSKLALMFLDMLEPLDREGWAILAHAPMEGWPSGEIIAAMCDTPGLKHLPPVDIVGHVTDRNPGGLYR